MRCYIVLMASLLAMPALAQEAAQTQPGPIPNVESAAMCTGVVDRSPVGAADVFSASVGRLWCFTRIAGIQGETSVTHVWYWGEQKVHEQPLAVRGPAWRTWSNKNVPPEWSGSWRVDVVAADGTVLKTIGFTVQ